MTAEEHTAKSVGIRKAECCECGGLRNCDIVGGHEEKGGDENFHWHRAWFLLKCRGCDNVFVQTVSTNSEDYHNGYDPDGEAYQEYAETINYWPALSKRKWPEWMSELGSSTSDCTDLDAALTELYGALNNDLNMLAAIGIRTSFDIAADLLDVDPAQSFKRKLEALVSRGHIGKVDQSRLEILVDAGSASAHRGWRPPAKDLSVLMDVLEHFVHEAFVVPSRKKRLDADLAKMKAKVPPRKSMIAKECRDPDG